MTRKKIATARSKEKPPFTPATWDPAKGPSDEQVDDAKRVLRADYYTSIRAHAEGVVAAIRGGELRDTDAVTDRIHQTADGSYWAISTHANYHALLASDHDPWEDVEDAGGELNPKDAASMLAYYCVRHDLIETVERELGESPDDYFARLDETDTEYSAR